jgi:ADP-L-glycero-D-manno-heptose 6-epimerase
MRILVTGGAGFIGANLSLALEEKGHNVAVIDNLSSGSSENLRGFKGDLVKGDISHLDLCATFRDQDFDTIFHQAAITDTTFDNEKEMIRVNVEGFRNILKFATSHKAKLIYASSAGVYGRGKIPMREDQELSPLNAYGLSKKTMDDLAKEEMRRDRIIIIGLRYFNVWGPGEEYKGKSSSMIYQLYRQLKTGKRPRIFKWGEQKRDFIYIKDVTRANLKAMEMDESCIVNIGTGIPTSFNRIVEILNQTVGTNLETEYFDNPYAFYQNETQADTALAYESLGFKAKFCPDEGIKDYISHLERNEDGQRCSLPLHKKSHENPLSPQRN